MKNLSLQKLLQVPDLKRGDLWEDCFLEKFVDSKVKLLNRSPEKWMDSWPYMMVSTEVNSVQDTGTDTGIDTGTDTGIDTDAGTGIDTDIEGVASLLHWLKGRGIGLCINPQKKLPDYLFTYGMLWHYEYQGSFLKRPLNKEDLLQEQEKVTFSPNERIYVANPFPHSIPEKPRCILRSFLQEQGLSEPKVLLISKDGVSYDLAFSLDSLGFPPRSEYKGIAEALSWFLPLHYSVLFLEEKLFPPFISL